MTFDHEGDKYINIMDSDLLKSGTWNIQDAVLAGNEYFENLIEEHQNGLELIRLSVFNLSRADV